MNRNNNRLRKSNKAKLPLHVLPPNMAAVLLVLTLISAHFTAGLYARYQATASGSDSARVAVWIVEARGEVSPDDLLDGKMTIDCSDSEEDNDSAIYEINVSNTKNGKTCEVSFDYDIIVELSEALPDGVTMELKCGDSSINSSVDDDETKYIYTKAGSFSAGSGAAHTYNLTFTGSDELEEDIDENSISVKIISTQKD